MTEEKTPLLQQFFRWLHSLFVKPLPDHIGHLWECSNCKARWLAKEEWSFQRMHVCDCDIEEGKAQIIDRERIT